MNRVLFTVFVTATFVAGCGGGSGNGLGSGNAPAPSLKITSANAVTVTGESYKAAMAGAGVSELGGTTGIIAGGSSDISKINAGIDAAAKTRSSESQVPVPETTTACDAEGFVTVSGDIADPITPTLTKNDNFTIVFDMCDDGLGEVTDGRLDLVVDAFSGDFLGGIFDLTMALELTEFQVMAGQDTLTSRGEATVTLDNTNSAAVSASVVGPMLTVDTKSSSETLRDFSSTQTLDTTVLPSPYTMTSMGTLETTQLQGVVRYSTPLLFRGVGIDYPDSGEFLVTGENSSARLVADNNVDVRILLDTDGDGETDETIDTTWAELAN